jgi:nitroreductase
MDYFDLIQKRYSVRAYKPDPVEDEKLQKILEAGCLAPTACNLQPFQVIVIPTAGHAKEIGRLYHRDWLSQAPLLLGICSRPASAWVRKDGKNYGDVDATIAMDHMILAACSLDLGTCWIAAFDPRAAREILRIPDALEPLAFTPLGYPADRMPPKKRKSLEELVIRHSW